MSAVPCGERAGAPGVVRAAEEGQQAEGGFVVTLPALLDRNAVARELFGVEKAVDARAAVDAVFRALPTVRLPNLAKPFVRGADLERLLEESTFNWRDGRVH